MNQGGAQDFAKQPAPRQTAAPTAQLVIWYVVNMPA